MTHRGLPLLALLVACVSAQTAPAQQNAPAGLVGSWIGKLEPLPGVSLTLVFHVKQANDGSFSATMDSPDQGATGLKVDSVKLDGQKAALEMKEIGASYKGTLSDDGQTLKGTFAQGGRETPMQLARTAEEGLPKPVTAPDELKGLWEGKLKLGGGIELRMVLRVEPAKAAPGRLAPFLDSPDQGSKGIPVTAIGLDASKVSFEVKPLGVAFSGTLNEAGDAISGTFEQGGAKLPLDLKKTEKVVEAKRPQMPAGPFPYTSEEVRVPNPEAEGVTLAGTLTIPEGAGPFPAAVLVSGSGPQDRDETLLGHKPFLVLADHLSRRGIAVLRFDDRGTAASTGDFAAATTADFATDALALVRFLKGRPEIAPGQVGIIGHSEGGLVGPIVAARAPDDVAFLVLLAGPGVPGDEILMRQSHLIALASGTSQSTAEVLQKANARVFKSLRDGATDEALEADFEAFKQEMEDTLPADAIEALEALGGDSTIATQLKTLRSPWFAYFLKHDPRPELQRVKCPVLALNGEKDLQVDPEQNLPEIEKALSAAGNTRVQTRVLPGLNHLFQPSETGAPSEYGKIETTLDPALLDAVASWLADITQGD
jgi:pimeloyl-ACP methyl ester carboxylesterase